MELMLDPVVLSSGHTYERASIREWLSQGRHTCPVTGARLRHLELTPNFALRSAIGEWRQAQGLRGSRPTRSEEDPEEEASGVLDKMMAGPEAHESIIWAMLALGRYLISASADRTIRVWDSTSRRCLAVLEGHSRPVLALAGRGRIFFSGSYDATVRAWLLEECSEVGREPVSIRCLGCLRGHADAVRALCLAGASLVSGSYDASLKVWDVRDWLDEGGGNGAREGVEEESESEGGAEAIEGTQLKTISIFEQTAAHPPDSQRPSPSSCPTLPSEPRLLATLTGHAGPVRALTWVGGRVFSGSYDGTLRAWSVSRLCVEGVMAGHSAAVRAVAAWNGVVLSGGDDASVRVWDARSLRCMRVLRGHANNVRVLAVGRRHLFSGSWDGCVRGWRLGSWEEAAELWGHRDAVLALAVLPGGGEEERREDELVAGRGIAREDERSSTEDERSSTEDGRSSTEDGRSSTEDGRSSTESELRPAAPSAPPQEDVLVSGSYDGTVRVWDVRAGRCLRVCKGHPEAVRVLATCRGRIFSGGFDGSLGIW